MIGKLQNNSQREIFSLKYSADFGQKIPLFENNI